MTPTESEVVRDARARAATAHHPRPIASSPVHHPCITPSVVSLAEAVLARTARIGEAHQSRITGGARPPSEEEGGCITPAPHPCVVCGEPLENPADLFCPVDWLARLRRAPWLCRHELAFYDPEVRRRRCGACRAPVARAGGRWILAENSQAAPVSENRETRTDENIGSVPVPCKRNAPESRAEAAP